MPAERRRKLLLGLLLVLLVFVGWRQLSGVFGGSAGNRSRGDSASLADAGGEVTEVVDLRVEDLERQRATYEPGRDPFRYGQAPVAERPRPKPVVRQPRDPAAEAAARAQRPVGPRLPTLDLVYLGNFGPAERRIAVFSDGEEIFNAMVGDVLMEQFEVVQIGYESADLGYIDFPDAPPTRLAVGG